LNLVGELTIKLDELLLAHLADLLQLGGNLDLLDMFLGLAHDSARQLVDRSERLSILALESDVDEAFGELFGVLEQCIGVNSLRASFTLTRLFPPACCGTGCRSLRVSCEPTSEMSSA
jgi:hypothetical protein